MKWNPVQQRLSQEFIEKVKARYSEVALLEIKESPEHEDDIWIYVNAPMDEERQIEMDGYAAQLSSDILTDYGYFILMMSFNPTVHA